MARERPLKTPREVTQSWPSRFRCGHGCEESRGREFGWLGVVNVNGSPSRTIFIHHLIRVGDLLTTNGPFHRGASLFACSGGVVSTNMRLPSRYGLVAAGAGGGAICW